MHSSSNISDLVTESKKTFLHTSAYVSGTFLVQLSRLLLIPIYTRLLTPSDYGIIALLCILSEAIFLASSMVVGSSIFYFYHNARSKQEKSRLLSTSYFAICAICLLLYIFGHSASRSVSSILFDNPNQAKIITVWLWAVIFELLCQVPFTYFRAENKTILYNTFFVARAFVGLLLNIWFVVYLRHGVMGVAQSLLLSYAILAIAVSLLMFHGTRFSFSFNILSKLFKYGLPLALSRANTVLIHSADRFLITKLVGLSDTGLYSLGCRFGNIAKNLVAAPFNLYWQNKIFEIAKKQNAKQIFSIMFTYLTCGLLLSSLLVAIAAEDAIRLVANENFWASHKVVWIISLAQIFWISRLYFEIGLYLKAKTKIIGWLSCIHSVIFVLLNYLFIPRYGYVGASFVLLITFFSWSFSTFLISNRIYAINYEWKRISLSISLSGIVFLVTRLVDFEPPCLCLVTRTLVGLVFPALLFLCGFFKDFEMEFINNLARRFCQKSSRLFTQRRSSIELKD